MAGNLYLGSTKVCPVYMANEKVTLSVVFWCPNESSMVYSRLYSITANGTTYTLSDSFTQMNNPSAVSGSKGSLYYGTLEFDKGTNVSWSVSYSAKAEIQNNSGTILMDESKTLIIYVINTIF